MLLEASTLYFYLMESVEADDGRPDACSSNRFGNESDNLPSKNIFDQAEFEQADITDWMFMRNDKIVGMETIKPLFKSMPKEDADAMRARMEPPLH